MGEIPKADREKPSDVLDRDIVRTIYNMQEADVASSQSSQERFYKRTLWGLQYTMNGIDPEPRKRVENDIRICKQIIVDLKASTSNSMDLKTKLDELYQSFAESHSFYVIDALSKVGIRKNFEDGEIDLSNTDLEILGKIIRSGHGLDKSVNETLDANEGKK